MSSICRLCLRNDDHIQKQNVFDLLVCDDLYWIFGVEVEVDDTFSKWICHKCLKIIKYVTKLKAFFQMNQLLLKEKQCPIDFDIEASELTFDVGTQTDHNPITDTVTLNWDTLAALNNPFVEVKKLEQSGIGRTYRKMTNSTYKRIRNKRFNKDEKNEKKVVRNSDKGCISSFSQVVIPNLETVFTRGCTKSDISLNKNLKKNQVESEDNIHDNIQESRFELEECIDGNYMELEDDISDNSAYIGINDIMDNVECLTMFDTPEQVDVINTEHINAKLLDAFDPISNVENVKRKTAKKTQEQFDPENKVLLQSFEEAISVSHVPNKIQTQTEKPAVSNIPKMLITSAGRHTRKEKENKLELGCVVNQIKETTFETSHLLNQNNNSAVNGFLESVDNYILPLENKEKRNIETRANNLEKFLDTPLCILSKQKRKKPTGITLKAIINEPPLLNPGGKPNIMKINKIVSANEDIMAPKNVHVEPAVNITKLNTKNNFQLDNKNTTVHSTDSIDARPSKDTLYSDLMRYFEIKSSYVELVRLEEQQFDERITGNDAISKPRKSNDASLNQPNVQKNLGVTDDYRGIEDSRISDINNCDISDAFHIESCDKCNAVFTSKELLKVHYGKQHKENSPRVIKHSKTKPNPKTTLPAGSPNLNKIFKFQKKMITKRIHCRQTEGVPFSKKSSARQKKTKNVRNVTIIVVSDDEDINNRNQPDATEKIADSDAEENKKTHKVRNTDRTQSHIQNQPDVTVINDSDIEDNKKKENRDLRNVDRARSRKQNPPGITAINESNTEGNKERENEPEVAEIVSESDIAANAEYRRTVTAKRGTEINKNRNLKDIGRQINKRKEANIVSIGDAKVTQNEKIYSTVPAQTNVNEEEIVDIVTVKSGGALVPIQRPIKTPIDVPEVILFPEVVEKLSGSSISAHDHNYVLSLRKNIMYKLKRDPVSSAKNAYKINETKNDIKVWKKIQNVLFDYITSGTSQMEEQYNAITTKLKIP